jgi:hypothetical protein
MTDKTVKVWGMDGSSYAIKLTDTGLFDPVLTDEGGNPIPLYRLAADAQERIKTFSKTDTLTRPAVGTAYAANQSINMSLAITGIAYAGLTVTLAVSGSPLVPGDYITVAGVNSGFTVTNIDGNWLCKAGTDATHVVFDVLVQPTGTTPQTATHGTVAKLLAFDVADAAGNGIILSEIKVSLPGIAAIGAIRAYLYIGQVPVLVDQSTFTLLVANSANRRDEYDIYPVTEGAGSDGCLGTWRGWEIVKCAANDTHIFLRLVAEAATTMTSAGVVSATVSGVQLGG